jgi:hypothetical protein
LWVALIVRMTFQSILRYHKETLKRKE